MRKIHYLDFRTSFINTEFPAYVNASSFYQVLMKYAFYSKNNASIIYLSKDDLYTLLARLFFESYFSTLDFNTYQNTVEINAKNILDVLKVNSFDLYFDFIDETPTDYFEIPSEVDKECYIIRGAKSEITSRELMELLDALNINYYSSRLKLDKEYLIEHITNNMYPDFKIEKYNLVV